MLFAITSDVDGGGKLDGLESANFPGCDWFKLGSVPPGMDNLKHHVNNRYIASKVCTLHLYSDAEDAALSLHSWL